MKEYLVEVPVYVTVDVTAASRGAAMDAAEALVAEMAEHQTSYAAPQGIGYDPGGTSQINSARLALLSDDEDRTPDVYDKPED